jgi:hypothetical protein
VGISYVKFCPQCKTTTAVETQVCIKCGHQFRTHFQVPESERTVAMTSADLPEGALSAAGTQAGFQPFPELPRPPRRRFPFRLLGFVTALALLGVLIASALAHWSLGADHPRPLNSGMPPMAAMVAQAAGSGSYEVIFTAGAQGLPAALAPHSPQDLHDYKPAGDDPDSVHLYQSGRIMLVYPGTQARVVQEGDGWRRVVLLDGSHKGETGYVARDVVARASEIPTVPEDILPAPTPAHR